MGVDLADFWRGRLSMRRLIALLRHLPPGSATFRAMEHPYAWTVAEYRLADLVDVTIAAHGGKSTVDRPGQKAAVEAQRRHQSDRFKKRTAARARRQMDAEEQTR